MRQKIVVVGGGGMGRCVLDVLDAIHEAGSTIETGVGFDVVGVVDNLEPDVRLLEARGVPYLGTVDALDAMPADVRYVIGLGDPALREKYDAHLAGRPCPVLVHPNAHIGFGVTLGPGTVICSHVSIESDVTLGRQVQVNQNSTIGHDARLGDFVTVSPLVAVSGRVTIGDAAFIGTGAAIIENLDIGSRAVIGAGAAVIRDTPAGVTAVGVPAAVK